MNRLDSFIRELEAIEDDIAPLDFGIPLPQPDEAPVLNPPAVRNHTSAAIWLKELLTKRGPLFLAAIEEAARNDPGACVSSEFPEAVLRASTGKKNFRRLRDGRISARLTCSEWLRLHYAKWGPEIIRADVLAAGVSVGYSESAVRSAACHALHLRRVIRDGKDAWRLGAGGTEPISIHLWIRNYLLEHGETESSIVVAAVVDALDASEKCARSYTQKIAGLHRRKVGTKMYWSVHTSRREAPPASEPAVKPSTHTRISVDRFIIELLKTRGELSRDDIREALIEAGFQPGASTTLLRRDPEINRRREEGTRKLWYTYVGR